MGLRFPVTLSLPGGGLRAGLCALTPCGHPGRHMFGGIQVSPSCQEGYGYRWRLLWWGSRFSGTALYSCCLPGISGFGSNNFQATHGQEDASESVSEPAASQITSGEGKMRSVIPSLLQSYPGNKLQVWIFLPQEGSKEQTPRRSSALSPFPKLPSTPVTKGRGPKRLRCSSWHLTQNHAPLEAPRAFPSSCANFPPLL